MQVLQFGLSLSIQFHSLHFTLEKKVEQREGNAKYIPGTLLGTLCGFPHSLLPIFRIRGAVGPFNRGSLRFSGVRDQGHLTLMPLLNPLQTPLLGKCNSPHLECNSALSDSPGFPNNFSFALQSSPWSKSFEQSAGCSEGDTHR